MIIISFAIFVLFSSIFCVSAIEKQLDYDIRDGLNRLTTKIGKLETRLKDLRNLKQRLDKVDALEKEVKHLRWLLKQ